MKKIVSLISLLVLAVASLVLAGCGSSNDNINKSVAISFANSSASWQRNGNTLKSLLEAEGFSVDLRFADTTDQQIDDIDKLLDQKPGCIVIGPIDSGVLADVLKKAKDNKTPVIAYDRNVLNTDAVSYLACYDSNAVGVAMGKYIENALNLKSGAGPFNIEIFGGADTDPNAPLFYTEAMKILKPYMDKGQLVCRSGETSFEKVFTKDWEPKNAQVRMERIYKQYYAGGASLDAIVSPNDGIAQGILEVLEQNGYAGHPVISGQDADPKALKSIAEGKQTFTIAKDPDKLAAKAVRMIKAVVEGTEPTLNDETSDNGVMKVPAYLCVPQIIDKTNIDQFLK